MLDETKLDNQADCHLRDTTYMKQFPEKPGLIKGGTPMSLTDFGLLDRGKSSILRILSCHERSLEFPSMLLVGEDGLQAFWSRTWIPGMVASIMPCPERVQIRRRMSGQAGKQW